MVEPPHTIAEVEAGAISFMSGVRLSRREILGGSIGFALSGERRAQAQTPAGSDAAAGPKYDRSAHSAADQLMFSTTKILLQADDGSAVGSGTGFLYDFSPISGTSLPCIISNKHVLTKTPRCSFSITRKADDSLGPDLSQHFEIAVNNLQQRVIGHPDPAIDIAILPIYPILNEKGLSISSLFYTTLNEMLIPTPEVMQTLSAGEDILTVGYPSGVLDSVHNLPIFHRGITATPPYVRYNGEDNFLIDVTTWQGSSGSPVFIYNPSGWIDPVRHITNLTPRVLLVGIVYGVLEVGINGNVTIQQVPGFPTPGMTVTTKVPTNIGACVNASVLLDFDDILFTLSGIKRPSDSPERKSSDYGRLSAP